MYVACSTLCFARHPLERCLRQIAEMEFSKVDVALDEHGPHLKPTEVAADVAAAAQRLRIGPSLSPAAVSAEIAAADPAEYVRQLRAVCRLARLCNIPAVTVAAAPSGTDLAAERSRLRGLVHVAESEGVLLLIDTRIGTLTEFPDAALELCRQVPGLGLTLDPSHYLAGPNRGASFESVYPHVRHVRLRDTGRDAEHFQIRVGQGEVEYGRIVTQLARHGYDRLLTVDIRDIPDAPYSLEQEVRKLKYLLESLV